MKNTTQNLIARLREADWFSRCGSLEAVDAVFVKSWAEAIGYFDTDDRSDLFLEAANQIRDVVRGRSVARYNEWNDIVIPLKPIVDELVALKCAAVVANQRLQKPFLDAVWWAILHAFVEAEYADICPPMFFTAQADWYCKGHFPCGWLGRYPEGKPVVF